MELVQSWRKFGGSGYRWCAKSDTVVCDIGSSFFDHGYPRGRRRLDFGRVFPNSMFVCYIVRYICMRSHLQSLTSLTKNNVNMGLGIHFQSLQNWEAVWHEASDF